MWKKGDIVELNGKKFELKDCVHQNGHKRCFQCAQVNGKRSPCISANDYPESDNMFNFHKCNVNMPDYCIPVPLKEEKDEGR